MKGRRQPRPNRNEIATGEAVVFDSHPGTREQMTKTQGRSRKRREKMRQDRDGRGGRILLYASKNTVFNSIIASSNIFKVN